MQGLVIVVALTSSTGLIGQQGGCSDCDARHSAWLHHCHRGSVTIMGGCYGSSGLAALADPLSGCYGPGGGGRAGLPEAARFAARFREPANPAYPGEGFGGLGYGRYGSPSMGFPRSNQLRGASFGRGLAKHGASGIGLGGDPGSDFSTDADGTHGLAEEEEEGDPAWGS